MRPAGFKHTNETKQKIRRSKIGQVNPMWKGDDVGYHALHDWARRHIAKPILCVCCGEQEPFDLSNISGEYKRELPDWHWLCRKCHMSLDGRLSKLREISPLKCGHRLYINRRRNDYGQFI